MRAPVVDACEVRLPGLPPALDGTVVVALSDLHLGSVLGADWLARRVAQVQGERPDLVLLLGDLFEGHGGAPTGELLPLLGKLSAPLGVWAVPGNHEDGHGGGGNGQVPVESAGITVLRDRWVQAAPGLVLAGVADGEKEGSFARALAGRPPGGVLLLSHSPHKADAAAAASGGGLMLSGHTHGGQVWPFGYLVRFRSPWVEGRFRVGGMDLIVTRGAGTWGPRMRLWLPGEILRITLRASSSV
jgi:predicted MPP superfamily phosphohydrolase